MPIIYYYLFQVVLRNKNQNLFEDLLRATLVGMVLTKMVAVLRRNTERESFYFWFLSIKNRKKTLHG